MQLGRERWLAGALAIVVGSTGVASAQDASAPAADPHPTAGSISLDLRIPISLIFSDDGLQPESPAIAAGLGYRLTDRWYVGVTGELGLAIAVPAGLARLGGEARYTFHKGEASVSTDSTDGIDGTWSSAPRYDWLGLRGGYETTGGSTGQFAELELGTDVWLGVAQVGIVLAGGFSIEPTHAFVATVDEDAPPVANPNPNATSYNPYVTIAFHFMFGH